MKQLFILLFFLPFCNFTFAQSDAYLDINNLKIGFNANNTMFVDYKNWRANYEFPKGSGKHSNFLNSFCITGLDSNNKLHSSASLFSSIQDFLPGPLDANDSIESSVSNGWKYVWKVDLKTIELFNNLTTHTLANTPNEILIWPAVGNIYARGKNNTILTIAETLAPFIDVNNDGIYNALDGDYPIIKGDQALWWVFSDNGNAYNRINSKPFKVQCQLMAYACKYESLENVFFLDMAIINKSDMPYHDMRTGLMSFVDLGAFNDDYIACDTDLNLAITYNGQNTDAVYNNGLTQHGCMLLKSPAITNFGDTKLGSFMMMNTWNFPNVNSQFHHALHGRFKDGTPQRKSCNTITGGNIVQHAFAGAFGSTDGSNENGCGNTAGDRAYLLATQSYNLAPNNVANHTFAFMNTPIGSNNASFSMLIDLAKDVKIDYAYNPNGCNDYPLQISNNTIENQFSIYPQPSHSAITISSANEYFTSAMIFSVDGKVMLKNNFAKSMHYQLSLPSLAVGHYILVLQTDKRIVRKKIVIE
jgi:Secretion system C-terminal sorting domain